MLTFNCTDPGGLSYVQDINVFITESPDVPKALTLSGDKLVQENLPEADTEEPIVVGDFSVVNELTSGYIETVRRLFHFV